jgi:hypothetical protein
VLQLGRSANACGNGISGGRLVFGRLLGGVRAAFPRLAARGASRCSTSSSRRRRRVMPDLAYVLVTIVAFVLLGLLVKGAERL